MSALLIQRILVRLRGLSVADLEAVLAFVRQRSAGVEDIPEGDRPCDRPCPGWLRGFVGMTRFCDTCFQADRHGSKGGAVPELGKDTCGRLGSK